MTILVLSALMLSPLDWHQFSIVFIVVCVRCQITSRSSPSARDMMSSVGTDRNGLLAAGPDLAGYQFTIRLAGFCRTKTGVWRVNIRQPELAGIFKFTSLFLDFCHYHVELHNKIVFTV